MTRCLALKTKLNRAIKAFKNLLYLKRNQGIQKYLIKLSVTSETNSLWKATKRLKRPRIQYPSIRKQARNWTRSDKEKTEIFTIHLSKIFKHNLRNITMKEEMKLILEAIISHLRYSYKIFHCIRNASCN